MDGRPFGAQHFCSVRSPHLPLNWADAGSRLSPDAVGPCAEIRACLGRQNTPHCSMLTATMLFDCQHCAYGLRGMPNSETHAAAFETIFLGAILPHVEGQSIGSIRKPAEHLRICGKGTAAFISALNSFEGHISCNRTGNMIE
eukprot:303151-Chlamydomonas_euryale.AAC.3